MKARLATAIEQTAVMIAYGLAGALVLGIFVVLPLTAHLSGWDEDTNGRGSTPVPTPTSTFTPVEWSFVDLECADGWLSDSIGKRGACSHHGGVVTVYEGSDGTVLRCGDEMGPPNAREQQQQLTDFGDLYCAQ